MADKRVTFIIGANIANFSKNLNSAQKQFTKFGSSLQNIGRNMSAFVTAPIVGAGVAAVAQAAKFQKLRVSMDVLNGSAEEGARNFERLKKFSASTPFQLEDLARAQNMLQGFGLSADVAYDSLKQIGDIAAVSGGDIQGIGIAFGQAAAEGRLMTKDIRQLINQGVPAIKLLADTMNVAESDVLDLASQGKISFEILQRAFSNATKTGGMFADGMKKQSQTISGLFSTLKDNVSLAMGELGQTLFEELNLGQLIRDITSGIQQLIIWFKGLSKESKQLGIALAAVFAVGGPILTGIGLMATLFGAISAPVLAVVAAVSALSLAILYIVDNWNAIKTRISDWSWWKNVLIDMAVFVIKYNPIALLLEPLEWVLKKLGIELPNAFDMVADKLIEMKDKPSEVYPEFGNFFDSVIGGAKKAAKSLLGIGESLGIGGGVESDTGGGQTNMPTTGSLTGLNQAPSIFADIGSALDVVLPKMDLLSIGIAAVNAQIDKAAEKKKKWAEVIAGVLTNAFDGLGNAILTGMEQGQNALQSFLKYFVDFAKGLLAKIISLIVAATVLSLILSTLGFGIGGGGGIKALGEGFTMGKSIVNVLKGGFGMERGGVVPSGFPNDSYPAMLTSGEMVLPKPTPLPSMGGNERLVTRLEGDDLLLIVERAQSKRYNTL